MSFYGNIFYGVADAFASLFIKNTGRFQDIFAVTEGNPIEIPAIGKGSHFSLDSGNKWIELIGDLNSQTCYIYHAKPKEEDGFNVASSFGVAQYGEENIHELSPGESFSASNIYYDNAGHVTKVEPISYKLPLSESEADVEEVKQEIEEIKSINEVQDANISNLELNYNSLIGEQNDIASDLSTLTTLVGSKGNLGLLETRPITAVIGPVKASLKDEFNDNAVTVCSAILSLKNESDQLTEDLKGWESKLGDVSSANRAALKNLCEALEAYNITINPDDLWESTGS